MPHHNENTLKLTTGAMFVAIFAILLTIDRYTGSTLTTLIMYILPIPMVAYSSKFGWKTSLPVLAAMGLISLILGNPLTLFYALSEAFLGLVFGTCIYHKVESTKTMFVVVLLAIILNVVDAVFISALSGYNLAAQVAQLQAAMEQAMDQATAISGQSASASVTAMYSLYQDTSFMMRLMALAIVLTGAIQGYLVYVISLSILRRLHFRIEKPKSLATLYPPKWTGWIAAILMLSYSGASASGKCSEDLLNILQFVGMAASLYLIFFGVIGVVLLVDIYVSKKKSVKILLGFMAYLMLSQITMVFGLMYLTSDFPKLLRQAQEEGKDK